MTYRKYRNLDITIERIDNAYRVRMLETDGTQVSGEFQLPFSPTEIENFILRVGRPRRGIRRLDSPEMAAAKRFGERLFRAVFQGDVYAHLQHCIEEAQSEEMGVRLRLRLGAPDLNELPWEYLYFPRDNQFFTLSADTPLVRYFDLPATARPLKVTPPLRLLAMIASPNDYPPLDVEREWRNLSAALEPLTRRGLLTIERLESASLLALQKRLRQGAYHIFHFIGHGKFDESAQDGLLLFSDENGHGRALSGQYLGTILRDHRTLRLAILNACEGARSGRQDPFAGAAQSLVQMGLPAVIAMQFEITDEAAITFAEHFYSALADNYPVDAALGEARKAIFACGNDIEWGTPVLFTRTPDGRIFDVPAQPAVAAAPAKPVSQAVPPSVPAQPRSLTEEAERLYEDGLSAFYLEDWARAAQRFQEALQRQPDHPAAAQKLAQAQRQLDLVQRYQQAVQHMDAKEWAAASKLLEGLAADAPNYRDTAARLKNACQQTRLAELYADAKRLSQAGQHQSVINIFEQIRQLDSAALDPLGLLPAAQKALKQQQEQERLQSLYTEALKAIGEENWQHAQRLLQQIAASESNYRETQALLSRAKSQLAFQQKTVRFSPATSSVQASAVPQVLKRTQPRKNLSGLLRWLGLAGGIGTLFVLLFLCGLLGSWLVSKNGPLSSFITTPTPILTPIIVNDAKGVPMALIPAGSFEMGSNNGDSHEKPVHTVTLDTFYMDIYEVTNARYAECMQAGKCPQSESKSYTRSSYYGNAQYADYPVIYVSWEDANTYCTWRDARLPTEAEWEKAARGGLEGKLYPWGDEAPVCSLGALNGANYDTCSNPNDTFAIGSFSANGYGLYDMAGNVWEWVADWYDSGYYSSSPAENPQGPTGGETRVLRGGSWNDDPNVLRVSVRFWDSPSYRSNSNGFRCSRSP